MIAKREIWSRQSSVGVWAGKYRNSHNLPHWHTECELLYVCDGEISVFCGESEYLLRQGEAFFIDGGQIHYMHAKTAQTVLVTIIFDYQIVEGMLHDKALVCPKLGGSYNVPQLYEQMRAELNAKLPHYETALSATIRLFVVNVLRGEPTHDKKKASSTSQLLRQLLDKIDDEYDTITFDDAASFMSLEQAYFSRYFKKYVGMSFSDYLSYVKTDNAVRLLQQKRLTVTEVALSCGFDCIRTFNRTFKKLTGYAPKELPQGFVLSEYFLHSDTSFDPTLGGTTLIE